MLTHDQILILFYGLSAIAIVGLLIRFFRRRNHTNDGSVRPTVPARSANAPIETTAESKAATTVDKADLPHVIESPSFADTRYRGSDYGAVSWTDRKLFQSATAHDAGYGTSAVPTIEAGDVPTTDRTDYVLGSLTPILAALLPESQRRRDQIKRDLKSAGYYQPHAVENLAAIRYLAIIVSLLACGVALLFVPAKLEWLVVSLLVVLPLLGWSIPRLLVRNRAANRQFEIERALPDLLDMLNMCVSQGMGIPHAIRHIVRDLQAISPPLAQELRIVCEQAELGTLPQAMENFSRRVDVSEVHSFAALIVQTDRLGTSVSEALTEYSDTMRESLRQRADARANQAAFQMLFPTVLCLMPAVFIFLLGPAITELSDFFYGGGSDVLDTSQQALRDLNP